MTKQKYRFMDFMDDFLFGPMNVIPDIIGNIRLVLAGASGRRITLTRRDKGGKTSYKDAKALLKRYGVESYGGGFNSQSLYTNVKDRQARWAEYVLARGGVKTKDRVIDRKSVLAARKHRGLPKAWADRKKK